MRISFISNMFFGGAMALKGTGYALEKSTSLVGGALHLAGDAVEKTGEVTSGACYSGAKVLERKAVEHDLSGISDEELIAEFQAQEEEELKSQGVATA